VFLSPRQEVRRINRNMRDVSNPFEIPGWKLRLDTVWAPASFPRVNVGAMMES